MLRIMLRSQWWIVFGFIVLSGVSLLFKFTIESGCNAGSSYIHLAPALLGLLFAFGVWRGEDPTHRAYHWAMPVVQGTHTLIKVFAGWVCLMGGLITIVVTQVIAAAITMVFSPSESLLWGTRGDWPWLAPFIASTVVYFLVSAILIGNRRPGWWIVGGTTAYATILATLVVLEVPADAVLTRYNPLMLLVTGNTLFIKHTPSGTDITGLVPLPVRAWFAGATLWLAISVITVIFAAYRPNRK
jgi:hypothetical protein